MMIKSFGSVEGLEEEKYDKIITSVEDVCRGYDVIAAYLYGSFIREEQHEGSDIDIAVYFRDHSLKKSLEVARKIREEAGVSTELDVRALNSAPPAFQFRVIQKGVVLYESSPGERADVEVKIARTYHDLKPRLEEHWELRRQNKIVSE